MSVNFKHSYTKELETLVLEELLPVYERWHQEHKLDIKYTKVHPDLVAEISRRKQVPKLFQPF